MDAHHLPELTERQLTILAALIRAYIQTPEPISSKQISDADDIGVSSATIRNEMAVLEQLGMIRAPHTSAGRVPTEAGYRYFVEHLLQEQELSRQEQRAIRAEFTQVAQDVHKWVRTAATVLAHRTQAAALVTEPRVRAARFKHLQLINTQGRLVLMILVLEGGELLQHLLTLAETVDQERLTQISLLINASYGGETAEGIRQKARTVGDTLTHEVLDLVAEMLAERRKP
ncbi:MAG: heat-inducible transcription repressor HrcA [Anaerolineae bacterium]|nr:heat-inducible transcription repressor HrcA [Anaerolineae bacterium]